MLLRPLFLYKTGLSEYTTKPLGWLSHYVPSAVPILLRTCGSVEWKLPRVGLIYIIAAYNVPLLKFSKVLKIPTWSSELLTLGVGAHKLVLVRRTSNRNLVCSLWYLNRLCSSNDHEAICNKLFCTVLDECVCSKVVSCLWSFYSDVKIRLP